MKEISNTNWASDPITEKDVTLDIPFQVDREGDLPYSSASKTKHQQQFSRLLAKRRKGCPPERELASALGVSSNTVKLTPTIGRQKE